MGFGFPASFTEHRIFHRQLDARMNAVKATLDGLGWRYEVLSSNELRARVGINLLSWGETLKVEISANGTISVESRCAFPLQCFDWGKNRINVQTFFTHLEQVKEGHTISGASETLPAAFDDRGLSPLGRILEEPTED